MKLAIVIVALLLAITSIHAEPLMCDPRMLDGAWKLFANAQYGAVDNEQAAFVMRDGDGVLAMRRWPSRAEARRAHVDDGLPSGVIAIVHTHPNRRPLPSPDDAHLASRLGIPVYVLTRNLVTSTSGTGFEYVLRGDWRPDANGRAASCRIVRQGSASNTTSPMTKPR